MAKRPNQKKKLLVLLDLLRRRTDELHPLPMPALLRALDEAGIPAERKSVYDDLATLGDLGYPVVYRRETPKGYYLASRPFELAELKLLVDSVQASHFFTKAQCERLIRKITALAGEAESSLLQRQVYVADRPTTENTAVYDNVDVLHHAIAGRRQISFRYYKWSPDKHLVPAHDYRTEGITPLSLCWDDENYYLVAYDARADKIKHYRVDKMKDIVLTDAPAQGQEAFRRLDMSVYSKQVFGMYGGELQLVSLLCDASLVGVLLDRFGTDISLIPQPGGRVRAAVRVMVSPLFLSWVAGFGKGMKILSPDGVRDAFLALLEESRSLYETE